MEERGLLYLGLDLSTQSLKATVVSEDLDIVFSESISFDFDLPHYATEGGFHRSKSNPELVTVPTLLWVEALEFLFDKMLINRFPFDKVRMISGSGQQHGSVYWKTGSLSLLQTLDPAHTLLEQLSDTFVTSG